MSIQLNQIVPWGRTRDEYSRMFALADSDLSDSILDCGSGPSSFTAELTACGHRAIALDPIYAFSGSEIRARFEAVTEPMLSQVRATPDSWVWNYHRDPEDLLAHRRTAMELFLADYEAGHQEGRYLVGELPTLPLASNSFGLAVCSHLLFLYSDLLSVDFHIRAARELCRVAREARIFPLLTLNGSPSKHLTAVQSALAAEGWQSEIVRVDYEFQRGGNQMLKIFRFQ